MNGWFKERVLSSSRTSRDEKQTSAGLLGSAEGRRFAQVVIGS